MATDHLLTPEEDVALARVLEAIDVLMADRKRQVIAWAIILRKLGHVDGLVERTIG